MALPQAKLDLVETLLGRHAAPAPGAGWAEEARAAAKARLRAMGGPVRRDEYWKYTDPTRLTAEAPTPAADLAAAEASPVGEPATMMTIRCTDGRLAPSALDGLAAEGLTVEALGDVLGRDIHWAGGLFGVLEAAGQDPVPRPLAALNTGVSDQGLVLRATGPVAQPVALSYGPANGDALFHHLIKVEAGASLTLIEAGTPAARFNTVIEVDVADGGSFHHIRTQGPDDGRAALTHVFARLGAEASFKSFTLAVNGSYTRNEAVITLAGDRGAAHIAAAAAGRGAFHHDDTVFVTHDAVDCESRQVFKKVLRDGAVGTFQGKILVKPDAQKTDGYQISQGLMLDDESQFLAKPELEIYADDVACSHGSTVGTVDADALFYLTSRGVPKAEAQELLLLAFLDEAIAEIADEWLAEAVRERLGDWMAHQARR